MTPQETDTKQALREYVNGLGLTYTATFQPRPQPRETVEHPQLHWLITLSNGKQSAQFPYSEGCGHVTGYKAFHATRYDTAQADARYRKACETGLVQVTEFARPIPQPAPDVLDVLYCLVLDASVRHSATYEEWASEYGYDADSRKGDETCRSFQRSTGFFRLPLDIIAFSAILNIISEWAKTHKHQQGSGDYDTTRAFEASRHWRNRTRRERGRHGTTHAKV